MPKNKGKGGKNRRRGKNDNDGEKRELQFKEDGQEYGQVVRMLGHGRLEANCFDGMKRLCHIRGKMRKRVWVNGGDIVLVSLREYQDSKGDVIAKYTSDEARCLKTYGELPSNAKINDTDMFEDQVDVGIEFLDDVAEESADEEPDHRRNDGVYSSSDEESKHGALDEDADSDAQTEAHYYYNHKRNSVATKLGKASSSVRATANKNNSNLIAAAGGKFVAIDSI